LGREGSFDLVRYLDKVTGTGEGGIAGGGDIGIRDEATAGVRTGPVMS